MEERTRRRADRPRLGWDGWSFAWWTYLLALALAAFLSFGLGYYTEAPHLWISSRDVWSTTNSAQFVADGGLGFVYSANPLYSALPGFLVLYAPVVALGEHLGLLSAYPYPLARPSMWLLTGPFFFLIGSTATFGVDYLAATLRLSSLRRKGLLLAVTLLVVGPTSGWAGHPEDLLALALSCAAVAFVIQGRTSRAAWILCAAILVQTWAGLLIPLLIMASPAGTRFRNLLRAALIPTAAGLLLLAVDFKDASLVLLKQPMTGSGQHLPWYGMAGHLVIPGWTQGTVVAGSSSRSLAVVAALAATLLVRRDRSPRMILLAAGLALFARGVFETEFWPYYLAPAAVFLALLVAVTTPDRPKRLAAGMAGAFLLYACAPMSYSGIHYPAFLALAILLATGSLCVFASFPALLRVGGRHPAPELARAPELAAQPG